MSARAPEAIRQLWNDIHALVPKAVLSGIVGDAAHSFGYHLARNELPPSDYSVILAPDRLGASDCASALDVSLPPDLMRVITARLVAAAKSHDTRLKALREFCGTLDGKNTYPWDVYQGDKSEGVNTWDDSHLWHIHLSFLREYADNHAALAPIADVFAGVPLVKEFTVDADAKARFDAVDKEIAAFRDAQQKQTQSLAVIEVWGDPKHPNNLNSIGKRLTAIEASLAALAAKK